jgi:hypothetical protein
MTIGPEPRMRMDLISLRLGIKLREVVRRKSARRLETHASKTARL